MEVFEDFDIEKQWPVAALLVIVIILVILLVRSSSGNSATDNEAMLGTAQSIAGTMVAVQMTGIAEQATATPTPEPTETEAPEPTAPQASPTQSNAGGTPCLAASFSDETIPDDTLMSPGESFTKGWVLTNIGTCTWTEEYGLAFHHGDDMNGEHYTPLAGQVAPGQSVTLTVDLVAPADAGSHIGFWSLQAPDGTYFGPSSTNAFWVRISIPGPTPTSMERQVSVATGGSVKSDGSVDSNRRAGDDPSNLGVQGFLTFTFGNLPDESTVTGVVLQMTPDYSVSGDPFASLGCLNVYLSYYGALDSSDYDNVSGGPLWSFCSEADLTGGATFGGSDAIEALQNAMAANQIQLSLQFEDETNSNGVQDFVRFDPVLNIYWYR